MLPLSASFTVRPEDDVGWILDPMRGLLLLFGASSLIRLKFLLRNWRTASWSYLISLAMPPPSKNPAIKARIRRGRSRIIISSSSLIVCARYKCIIYFFMKGLEGRDSAWRCCRAYYYLAEHAVDASWMDSSRFIILPKPDIGRHSIRYGENVVVVFMESEGRSSISRSDIMRNHLLKE